VRTSRTFLALLLAAALTGCGKLTKDTLALGEAGCPAETAASLLARQNELGPRSSTQDLRCALGTLRASQDPALAKTALGSRVALSLAERNPDPAARNQLAAEGVRFAETALAQGGDGDPAVHYYLAANLGLAIRGQPTLAADNLPRVEKEAKRALDLNPGLDDGGPLRLLGMLYLKAPPWPAGIGDGDKALDLLRQAAERHPEHPLNRLFYAQALWEVEGDSAAAKARSEFAAGEKALKQGEWGGARETWSREFEAVRKEIGAGS
jgi:tetratricopeptide (TPR) repeat protein